MDKREIKNSFLFLALCFLISACSTGDKIIEKELGERDYPLPKVVEPVAAPVAKPVMETADEVLKERTIQDTTTAKKRGGYKATLFPKSKSEEDDGTAFKISW